MNISITHLRILNLFNYLISVTLLLTFASCNNNDPSAAEVATGKLTAHPWKLKTATVDGTDQTAVYSGLQITFSTTGYSTISKTPSWSTVGTWKFIDESANAIVRNDNLEITIVELTDDQLKISYTWSSNTFASGRKESLTGSHVLMFSN